MGSILERLAVGLESKYRVEHELGRGGMATVYYAWDIRHDRPVALKLLHPELAITVGPERFQREIRVAARLQHPHILTVHDSGEIPATGTSPVLLWFTMPYVEGETLRDRLVRERQLQVEDAVRMARESALALEYAHQHGVVHRDIKPENILVTQDGMTLVADFGIAQALHERGEAITQSGLALGTPSYMSPEQASGERGLDARTDIYSLGCVLYEMLAGERPFSGPTPQVVLARIMTEPPRSVRLIRSAVPPSLDAVIARAMARTPADRFPTMAAFALALAPILSTPVGTPTMQGLKAGRTSGSRARWQGVRRPLFAMLALGFALGLGVLFAWKRPHAQSTALLAVLPFDNQGEPADAYFADGISDEIRGRLASIPGVEVIGRASSTGYKGTAKDDKLIAEELGGARYLLRATVRWDKTSRPNKVHVSPELVEVPRSGAPRIRWQRVFDAKLTDVFQVQADIANQVAGELHLVLGDSVAPHPADHPTRNPAAYDAYLRGEEASQGMSAMDLASLQRAVSEYQRAVALDSTFFEAWAHLAQTHGLLYMSTRSPEEAQAAQLAAQRALALQPNRAEGHLTLAEYFKAVLADTSRALAEDSAAAALAPGNPDLLTTLAGDEWSVGRWDEARGHYRKASRLDPRSLAAALRLGRAELWTRHYPEAELAYDQALTLAPANLAARQYRAMVDLARGDLAGARAVVRQAPTAISPATVAAHFATFYDLVWVLTVEQQDLLLAAPAAEFEGDQGARALVFAQIYHLRGDLNRARSYADSARVMFEAQLKAAADDPTLHTALGLALAYLDRGMDAIREGSRGAALVPANKDASYHRHQLARILVLTGQLDPAAEALEELLRGPYLLSPGWLRIDPNFAPLKGNPRFQKLVGRG